MHREGLESTQTGACILSFRSDEAWKLNAKHAGTPVKQGQLCSVPKEVGKGSDGTGLGPVLVDGRVSLSLGFTWEKGVLYSR